MSGWAFPVVVASAWEPVPPPARHYRAWWALYRFLVLGRFSRRRPSRSRLQPQERFLRDVVGNVHCRLRGRNSNPLGSGKVYPGWREPLVDVGRCLVLANSFHKVISLRSGGIVASWAFRSSRSWTTVPGTYCSVGHFVYWRVRNAEVPLESGLQPPLEAKSLGE